MKVDAAVAAGVGHVVYTSVLRADSTQLAIAPEHKATERVIRQSNVPFTFLRNSFYTENYTAQIPSYLARGAIVGAAGGALISAAPRADYAAACVAALTQDSHRNAVYRGRHRPRRRLHRQPRPGPPHPTGTHPAGRGDSRGCPRLTSSTRPARSAA